MVWTDAAMFFLILFSVYGVWLWTTEPDYEDGEYVPVTQRLRKIFVRVFSGRD